MSPFNYEYEIMNYGFACFPKPQFGGGLNQNLSGLLLPFKVNLISYLISVHQDKTDSIKGKRLICSVGLSVESIFLQEVS